MIHAFTAMKQRVRSLMRDEHGLALVEFALSLPVLLIISMVGLECANLALAHLRISQVAMLVADNAARVRTSIDEANVNEIMIGANLSTASLKLQDNGNIILSDVESNGLPQPLAGQYIRWQRCWGAGPFTSSYGKANDGLLDALLAAGIGPANRTISASPGSAIMFVEVAYNYQPLISSSIFGTKVIRYTSAFPVRERTDQQMKNGGNLPAAQTARCPS